MLNAVMSHLTPEQTPLGEEVSSLVVADTPARLHPCTRPVPNTRFAIEGFHLTFLGLLPRACGWWFPVELMSGAKESDP